MKYRLLLAAFVLSLNLHAGEDHGHGHSHEHLEVPSTLPEVRAVIAAKQRELTALLEAGKAAEAHHVTDVLSACVKAIPGLLGSLDETAKQRVEGMANNTAKAWASVAHDADHGDYEGAGREAVKAAAAYKLLEARLPQ